MAAPDKSCRLIVNADDFGRSPSINAAVIRAHREGILTSASLMVNEPACAEAVALAKENPRLGVGLHLALVCGRAALPAREIPGFVNARGEFSDNPVAAGCRFFFSGKLKRQLHDEIAAQFEKFRATGLKLDHVNGHLNIHLHPTIFAILMANAEKWGIRHLRLTCDPLRLNLKLASGQLAYRFSHAAIYRLLSWPARATLRRKNTRHTARVFGLLQNAHVDEAFVLKLLTQLPPGDSELYSHPSLDEFRHEFDALVSPRVKELVVQANIRLIRYQDL
ncbi:MAG: hopanoid biosynthesis-associated protein HpnK [Verrucomicrobia bacterium]|nr:hopanoid biosynthesis-associated protein HpnK [Verrucomicrobiota bacterium]